MDNTETISNPTLRSPGIRKPLWPARFTALGSVRSRAQADGSSVLFVAIELKTVFTGVPSKLDGYSSDWYTTERRWIALDSIEPGQLQLVKVV